MHPLGYLIHEVVVVLFKLGDLFLADPLEVVIQRVRSDDLDQILHCVQDFHVLTLWIYKKDESHEHERMLDPKARNVMLRIEVVKPFVLPRYTVL